VFFQNGDQFVREIDAADPLRLRRYNFAVKAIDAATHHLSFLKMS
jgi:hypothetical protein